MKSNGTAAVMARPAHLSPILLLCALSLVLFVKTTRQPAGRTSRFGVSAVSTLRLQPPGNLIERLLKSSSLFFSAAQKGATDPGFIVHEWGTFTSIAGSDGQAMDWLPLTGSTDLPSFVEHFRKRKFQGRTSRHRPHGNAGVVFLLATRDHRFGQSFLC